MWYAYDRTKMQCPRSMQTAPRMHSRPTEWAMSFPSPKSFCFPRLKRVNVLFYKMNFNAKSLNKLTWTEWMRCLVSSITTMIDAFERVIGTFNFITFNYITFIRTITHQIGRYAKFGWFAPELLARMVWKESAKF